MAVIVIDFDGTIVENNYPSAGKLKLNAKEVINRLFEHGHDILINTCRSGYFEGIAEEFLMYNKISFNYINCNLPEKIEMYGRDCRKISGDIYIDDSNLFHIDDWLIIEAELARKGIYTSNTEPYTDGAVCNNTITTGSDPSQ